MYRLRFKQAMANVRDKTLFSTVVPLRGLATSYHPDIMKQVDSLIVGVQHDIVVWVWAACKEGAWSRIKELL